MNLVSLKRKHRSYLAYIFLAIAVIILSITHVFVNNRQKQSETVAQNINHSHRVIHLITQLQSHIYKLETTSRGFVILQDNALLDTFNNSAAKLSEITHDLTLLVNEHPEQQKRATQLAELSKRKVEYSKQFLVLAVKNEEQISIDLLRTSEGHILSSGIASLSNEFIRNENLLLKERIEETKRSHENVANLTMFADIVALLALLGGLLVLFYQIKTSNLFRKKELAHHKQLKQFLDSMPGGVLVIDRDQQIVFINDQARKILEIGDQTFNHIEDLVNTIHIKGIDGQPIDMQQLPLSLAIQGNPSAQIELMLETSKGIKFLESKSAPIFDLDNNLEFGISVIKDITHRKALEKDLKSAKEEAEQVVKTRDVFLTNISHELRTPLNAILGFTSLLRQQESDEEKYKQLTAISHSGENLLTLINDLLDLSRIESGQMSVEKIPVQLGALIDSITIPMRQRAHEKGLYFEVVQSEELLMYILSDPLRITQILNNLCSNAIKFTEKGGVILKVNTVHVKAEQYELILEISDTGIGIKEDRTESIFNRFTQAAEDIPRKYGGSGLGLSIVRQLVQLMGGVINLKSIFGEGSTFKVRLPVQRVNVDQIQNSSMDLDDFDLEYMKKDITILVVEDNDINQRLVRAYLEKNQISSHVAENGKEAIELIKTNNFSLVLMDIQMPVMDGYTSTELIRKFNKTLPIVAMTAHAMEGEREKCMRAGMNDYLSKPIRESSLLRMIKKHCAHKELAISVQSVNKEIESRLYSDRLNMPLIKELMETPELFKELIQMFEEDYSENLSRIHLNTREQNMAAAAEVVHKFRSSVSSIGLKAIENKLSMVETELKSTNGLSKENYLWLLKLPAEIVKDISSLQQLFEPVSKE